MQAELPQVQAAVIPATVIQQSPHSRYRERHTYSRRPLFGWRILEPGSAS